MIVMSGFLQFVNFIHQNDMWYVYDVVSNEYVVYWNPRFPVTVSRIDKNRVVSSWPDEVLAKEIIDSLNFCRMFSD
jgi:hypothetical protein